MKKLFLLAPILFLLFWAGAENTFACSCGEIPAPLEEQVESAFKNSTVVFSGEVISIKPDPKDQFSLVVEFKAKKSWKGKFAKRLIITTASNSAACGYTFEVGKKYLVYTYGENDKLSTGICTRTAGITSNKDVAILNKIKKKKT